VLADREGVIVELRDAEGVVGVGEASPFTALGGGTVADVLALLEERCEALLLDPAPAALPLRGPGVAALRCALDTALLDLEGQRRGLSIAALLNPGALMRVPVNAVIGAGSPDEVASFGADAVAAGYQTLKLKVGVGGLDADLARVEALRLRCPAAEIRVDANGAWDEQHARAALERLLPLRIELIEQPVAADDLDALKRLRWADIGRLAADETIEDEDSARRVLSASAADLLVLKPMRLGGLRPALAIARRAARTGVGCFVTTTFDSSIGTALALQLAAALPSTPVAHGLSTGEHLAADVVAEPLVPKAGEMELPNVAGLGIEVEPGALEAVAQGPWIERVRV
jgi:o-succinylbenzoate synthase